ncbi:MAG: hydrolase, partial [Desulfatiglandales bacterium]
QDLNRHTMKAKEILEESGAPPEVVEAVIMHNEIPWGKRRWKRIHHALAAGENLTGLIIATALVMPDRRLGSVTAKSILRRMKEKRFAQGANREVIMEGQELGLSLEEFVSISLSAMQEIGEELGL